MRFNCELLKTNGKFQYIFHTEIVFANLRKKNTYNNDSNMGSPFVHPENFMQKRLYGDHYFIAFHSQHNKACLDNSIY